MKQSNTTHPLGENITIIRRSATSLFLSIKKVKELEIANYEKLKPLFHIFILKTRFVLKHIRKKQLFPMC